MQTTIGDDSLPFLPLEDYVKLSLPQIDALRQEMPVIRTTPTRGSLRRDEDVRAMMSHPDLVQIPGPQFCDFAGIPPGRCRTFLETFMLMTNGEDHKHRRGAFARVFAQHVCSLSNCLMIPYVGHEDIEASANAMYDFVAAILEDRRQAPQDDLISMLVSDESDRALENEELIYQIMGRILGGSDTTRSGFNMIVVRLLFDRSLWDKVQADRSLIPSAIDEALRLEPPVAGVARYNVASIEVAGVTLAAGQLVGLSTMSAMRDETRVSNPEIFDLHREDRQLLHVVLGAGAHRCLGEMLARLEMEEGLAALLDGAPDIEMVEAPKMVGVPGLRKSTPMIARIPQASVPADKSVTQHS